jgi:hypothetical protein
MLPVTITKDAKDVILRVTQIVGRVVKGTNLIIGAKDPSQQHKGNDIIPHYYMRGEFNAPPRRR